MYRVVIQTQNFKRKNKYILKWNKKKKLNTVKIRNMVKISYTFYSKVNMKLCRPLRSVCLFGNENKDRRKQK